MSEIYHPALDDVDDLLLIEDGVQQWNGNYLIYFIYIYNIYVYV